MKIFCFTHIFILLLFCFHKDTLAQRDNLFSFKVNMGANQAGVYSDIQAGIFLRDITSTFLTIPDKLLSVCVGIENNYLFKTDFRLVPKASVDYHFTEFPFSFGLQMRYYPNKNLDFSRASVQLCPHIGTNFLTAGYINFGHNFALSNKEYANNTGFQVNIGVNFPLE